MEHFEIEDITLSIMNNLHFFVLYRNDNRLVPAQNEVPNTDAVLAGGGRVGLLTGYLR